MKLRKLKQDFLRFVGTYILNYAVNIVCKSIRIRYNNLNIIEDLENQNKNFVLAFWHGNMLVPWFQFRNKKIAALISKSKDGDLLAKLLRHWKYQVVRGSSSSGGNTALGIMVDYAKNKCSVAVTPDGPKGPRFKFKAGAVITAKKSGIPLVLVAAGIKRKRILNSWDHFEIPKLFSEVNVFFYGPIFIDPKLSYEDTSKVIKDCENTLSELSSKANLFN